MGLGPSIKMTTLHHFRCPVTKQLLDDPDVEFTGILVDGVSENCDDKLYTAARTADMAQMMGADGAVVAIDGWGNHHVDFVNVIEQLSIRGIPSVGLSYLGLQGRLVCDSPYVDCIVDFNKSSSGYESCVVGENNLDEQDALKAVVLLKSKLKKTGKLESYSIPKPASGHIETATNSLSEKSVTVSDVSNRTVFSKTAAHMTDGTSPSRILRRLTRKTFHVKEVRFGAETSLRQGVLALDQRLQAPAVLEPERIREIRVEILPPNTSRHIRVNSNLDFSPIACKTAGVLGEGTTHLLSGVTLMLTGVEEISGFQPSNIGSSEGYLDQQVVFDRAGTPTSSDYLLHIDILFREGEGRTAQGIMAAHRAADRIAAEIRRVMQNIPDMPYTREEFTSRTCPGRPKVLLVKIVSGLGNMYDTCLFPAEPGGFLGSHSMMASRNLPYAIFPTQCLDGVIHSLL